MGGAAGNKRACVTGASGYLGAMLVKSLLEKGYAVNATVRDPANSKKVEHLLALQGLGDLKLFKADLTEECSFEEAIRGCDFVFHVATPVLLTSDDPENEVIKPAVNGVLNVLRSCAKIETVKRVVYTSSIASVHYNQLTGTDLVFNEDIWSDVEYMTSKKPYSWAYAVSKTLAEKMAFEFAKENNLDLISILPVVIAGPSTTPEVPGGIAVALSLITGDENGSQWIKFAQLYLGSVALVHVMDVCRAHIFAAESKSVSGRYVCSALNASVPELAKFAAQRYPQYNVRFGLDNLPSQRKVSISSEKLIKAGFTYNYGIEEIYDDSVEYIKALGLLAK